MATLRFETTREARDHLKALLDAAAEGRPASVRRESGLAAVVDAERLRYFLATLSPIRAQVVPDGDRWTVLLPGLPIAADGATLDEALDEAVLALRDYADAWTERLRHAPNHADNWGLVQLVELSTDEQLLDWLTGR